MALKDQILTDDDRRSIGSSIWRTSTNPTAMLALLPTDEERLRVWAEECDRLWQKYAGRASYIQSSHDDPQYWLNEYFADPDADTTNYVSKHEAADLLRCIYPDPTRPQERECDGRIVPFVPKEPFAKSDWACNKCRKKSTHEYSDMSCSGRVPAPRIEKRWLSSAVCDLVKLAAGQEECRRCNGGRRGYGNWDSGKWVGGCVDCNYTGNIFKPDYSRLPILADALMDAGCDDVELLEHLRADVHILGECWAMKLLEEAIR